MWLVYNITDPTRLSEVKIPTPAEMKEYLDLCLEFCADFTHEQCLKYWQEHREMYGKLDYHPFSIGDRCAKTLKSYLEFAEIPISANDQAQLDRATASDGHWMSVAEHETSGIGVSIEDFPALFENQYLKDALRIYTVCNIIDTLHNYNGRLEQYCHCMTSAHDLVCLNSRYQKYSLHAFDTTGYSASRATPNRLNYGYSMADSALGDLKQIHRYHMRQSLTHDKWDPFCQQELADYLSKLYGDKVTADIHPLVIPQLGNSIKRIIKANHDLYRHLGPIAKVNYGDMKPHRDDYDFFDAMQTGVRIWHNSKFYQKHHRKIRRILELFDLVERVVVYKYVLPDGCFANLCIFNLPGFGGSCDENSRDVGPSLHYTEDESVLKRIWEDGLRVEFTNGEIIMHPAEESTVDSPWYTKRLEAEFSHRGQSDVYEEYKHISNPWMPGPRFVAEHLAAEA